MFIVYYNFMCVVSALSKTIIIDIIYCIINWRHRLRHFNAEAYLCYFFELKYLSTLYLFKSIYK